MTEKEFRHILETGISGVPFTASVKQHNTTNTLVGKLHTALHVRKFWLCFDEGEDGNRSPEMHGYIKSWAVDVHNCKDVAFMTIMPMEPVIINEYQIY